MLNKAATEAQTAKQQVRDTSGAYPTDAYPTEPTSPTAGSTRTVGLT